MPALTIRDKNEVEGPSRSSRAARARQATYDDFLKALAEVPGTVGDLELTDEEKAQVRSIKVMLRRAAGRAKIQIEIWGGDGEQAGHIYFQKVEGKGKGSGGSGSASTSTSTPASARTSNRPSRSRSRNQTTAASASEPEQVQVGPEAEPEDAIANAIPMPAPDGGIVVENEETEAAVSAV